MANNIYIGNRYVPIFANPVEWDNLREYEPLTIVTYQGTAYTSRKTVPVGTALSNTEYWVVTGNYNAQVEEYRQEVVALDTEIDAVSDRVSVLEDDVLVTIGDSYLGGYTPDGVIANNWGKLLAELMGISNANYKTNSVGGTGFVNDGYTGLLNSLANTMTTTQKNKTKWVVVGGCFNDGGSTATNIKAGMHTFSVAARNHFPNAKIYAIPFGWECKQLIPPAVDTNRTYQHLANATIAWFEGCVNEGFLTGDEVYSVLYNNSLFSSDYYHPNANGQAILGGAIYQTILGGGSTGLLSGYNKSLQNFTAYQGTINNLQGIAYWVAGKYTNVDMYGYNFIYTPTSPFDISAVNYFGRKIGEYKDAGLATGGQGISIPVTAYVQTSGSGFWELTGCSLVIKNNEVWFYTGCQINEGHGNYLSITGITKITLFPQTLRTMVPNLTLCI